jgi:hypothetical protein
MGDYQGTVPSWHAVDYIRTILTKSTLGSGGPGVAADMDALYNQAGADPAAWAGRAQATSSYAQELQQTGTGAYSADSGWVSGMVRRL